MFKFDSLVPVILIVCLIALAYILSKVFSPSEQEVRSRPSTEIVLDADRYRDDADLGASTNLDNTNNSSDDTANSGETVRETEQEALNDYYEDGSRGTIESASQNNKANVSGSSTSDYSDTDEVANTNLSANKTATSTNTSSTGVATYQDIRRGAYHVIAGSFRQKAYAQQLVRELKRDGFSDAYVGYMNRGTYAVAVAGSSSSYSKAETIRSRVKSAGYDVFIKKGE